MTQLNLLEEMIIDNFAGGDICKEFKAKKRIRGEKNESNH